MQLISLIVVIILCFFLIITVGILFIWHLYYIAQNITTIEDHENSSIEKLKRRGIIPKDIIYPYDLGVWNNFKQVFGDKWYLWCLPIKGSGDGLHYQVKEKITWPPRQYYIYKKYPQGKLSRKDREDNKQRGLVRRDSEGYIVKQLTAQDRESLLQDLVEKVPLNYVSSTDYDSLESEEKEEGLLADSDDEVLADRMKRIT